MPRLIKLASDNSTIADFQNFFTEDILIKPNSKVALYNLSLTLDERVFEVNLSNFQFRAQVKGVGGGGAGGGFKLVSLQLGTYNKTTFLADLTRAINTAFAITDGSNNGLTRNEWKPIYDTTNKLKIQYNGTIDDANGTIGMQMGTFSFGGVNLTKLGTDNSWDSCYTNTIFQNGVGQIKCTLNNNQNGVCVGLINDTSNGLILEPSNYYACVYSDAGVYKYNFNGLTTTTAVAVANAHVMKIVLELGLLKFYAGAGAGQLLGSVSYTYAELLHGAVSFFLNANAVSNLTYSPSPYQNTNASGVSHVQTNEEIQDQENYIAFDNVGAPSNTGAIHALRFTNGSMQLLGYATIDVVDISKVFGSFDGTKGLLFGELADTLTVEIPSLDLTGYDGEVHRRRNILSILPADENAGVQRNYQAVYPIYIDVNNRSEQLLNTIQVRVLDEAGIPVNILAIPGVIITILLD